MMLETKNMPAQKKKVVAVSGGFDPVHIGHVRMFEEAKKLGDELVVILNNNNWLRQKKGFAFMDEIERGEIIASFAAVDRVVITSHEPGAVDMSVCRELEEIRPDIFANGGDRKPDGVPVPEVTLCERLGIEMHYNVGYGGKVQSSSWLTAQANGNKKEPIFSAWRLSTVALVIAAFLVFIGATDVLARLINSFL